jgi:hypothetical protein
MTGEPTPKTVKSIQKPVKEGKSPKAVKEGKIKRKQN